VRLLNEPSSESLGLSAFINSFNYYADDNKISLELIMITQQDQGFCCFCKETFFFEISCKKCRFEFYSN